MKTPTSTETQRAPAGWAAYKSWAHAVRRHRPQADSAIAWARHPLKHVRGLAVDLREAWRFELGDLFNIEVDDSIE